MLIAGAASIWVMTATFQWKDEASWLAFKTHEVNEASCYEAERRYEEKYRNGEFRDWVLVSTSCEPLGEEDAVSL